MTSEKKKAQEKRRARLGTAIFALNLIVAIGAISTGHFREWLSAGLGSGPANAVETAALTPERQTSNEPPPIPSVQLSDTQLASLKVEPVGEYAFPIEKAAVGSIDFNEEMSLQVFTPYQGRILTLSATLGDEVKKGDTLFTIDSPDLLQAESNLISAAGVAELNARNLARLKQLYESRAIAQKDMEQAISDQQASEGALKAARDAVRIFGKTEAEIARMIAERKVDPTLVVPSPISGRITARNAAPGLFVQPGNAPAPYSIADLSTVWMLANVAESDSPAFSVGQDVRVSVMAYPGRVFEGKISTIGATVDPNTHRVLVRSEISDPKRELRPGMFANFVIRTGEPVSAPAIPFDGVVREGDGTMTVWVTIDHHRFFRRTVKVGLQRDGYDQILEGLKRGELVATEGALFLSNALTTATR
jgi:membrane fusion protein, heavy metal efflux system